MPQTSVRTLRAVAVAQAIIRSERTIEELANAELGRSSYYHVRRICCDYHDGVLTLRGRVPNFYMKQVAQCLLHGLDGVVIDNRVEVVSHS